MKNHTVWSFTASEYTRPVTLQLYSLCKHAPLRSIALAPPVDAPAQRQLALLPYHRQQQLLQQQLQQQLELLLQQKQQQQADGSKDGCTALQQVAAEDALLSDTTTQQLTLQQQQQAVGSCDTQHAHLGQQEQPHWHVVNYCAAQQWQPDLQHQVLPEQQLLQEAEHEGDVAPCPTQAPSLQQPTASSSSSSGHAGYNSLRQQEQQQPPAAAATAAPQPEPLFMLIAASRRRQQMHSVSYIQWLLEQLQPLLPKLAPEHLAHAAAAASQLAQQQQQLAPCQDWQQQLLEAASRHFQAAGSMDTTSTATLLQALVKLQLQPGPAWMATCCAGVMIGQECSPRVLSTIAACLPQLGYVPDSSWAQQFFVATAASLPDFPAISLARMLHGVVAWQQQGQQQQQQQQVFIPEQWLLCVLHSLNTHSSQLNPAELAMAMQSLQRLQQQQQQPTLQLLPLQGQQASTPLQQAGQQLLHSLMAAVLHQLRGFRGKDLTVLMFAVASLQQQQQQQQGTEQGWRRQQQQQDLPGVSWTWLQHVLAAVEEQLPRLDARGQATCLAAAAVLIKPLLKRQQQQQQQQAASNAAQPGLHLQQQQEFRQQGRQAMPAPVKPLQRWLQQQAAQATAGLAAAPPSGTPPAAGSGAAAVLSQTQASTATAPSVDVAGYWSHWLSSFCTHSSSQLSSFSSEDLTVAACSLANLHEVPPVAWYEALLGAVHQQLQHMSAGQVSGVAWALGRMALLPSQHNSGVALVPSATWLQQLYAFSPAALPAAATTAVGAEEDSTAVGPAAGRGCMYSIASCSGEECVRLMWAAGVCEFDPGDTWWAAAEHRLQALAATAGSSGGEQQQQQAVVPARLLGALAQAYAAAGRSVPPDVLQQLLLAPQAQQQLLHSPAENTIRLLRSLRQAGVVLPQLWLQQLAVALQPDLGLMQPDEFAQLLQSLADAGLQLQGGWLWQQGGLFDAQADRPDSAADSAADGAAENKVTAGPGIQAANMPTSSNVTGSNAASGSSSGISNLADSSSSGGSSWRDACLTACLQLLPRMSVRGISMLLCSCAKLQLKPPPHWLQAALGWMQAGFLDAEPGALALGITALSQLGYLPNADWMGSYLMAMHRKVAALAASPSSDKLLLVRVILQTLWGLGGLAASPNPKWLKLMLVTLHQQLHFLQPNQVCSLLLVLARLRCRPSPVFLQSLLDHLGDCSSCSNSDLVNVMYAAAALRWKPSRSWCKAYLAVSGRRLAALNPRGLALLQWSLAVVRVVPPKRWRGAAVAAVVMQLEAFDGRELGMVVWAWGRHMVHLTPKEDKAAAAATAATATAAQLAQQQEQQRQEALEGQQQQQGQGALQTNTISRLAEAYSDVTPLPLPPWLLQKQQQQEEKRVVVRRVLAAAWRLRGSYSAASLVHLLVGVAKLRLCPSQAWLQDMVLQGSRERLSVLNGYELQQLLWALAVMGYQAQQGWLSNVGLLLVVRSQRHNSTRFSADWALGRLQQLAAGVQGGSAGMPEAAGQRSGRVP